ncbi:MAG: carbohydrate ABC transporter permease [Anaerolineae bacterium]
MEISSDQQRKIYRPQSPRSALPWLGMAFAYCLVGLGAISMVVPFLWMLRTSLMREGQARLFPPVWIPTPFVLDNYVEVWRRIPMGLFTLNSLKIATLSTFGVLLSCSFCAFGFSRLRFPGRDVIFALLLLTMMIPGSVTLIPMYILFSRIGWINSHNPLIVPAFFGSAFGIFLLRQFFLTLPQELFDAATVDGADPVRQYWQISLPLAKPALMTLALFQFVGSWADLMGPLIYLNSRDKMTLPVGVALFRGQYYTEIGKLMAASAIMAFPMVFLFIFTQRYFVRGIALTGIKG